MSEFGKNKMCLPQYLIYMSVVSAEKKSETEQVKYSLSNIKIIGQRLEGQNVVRLVGQNVVRPEGQNVVRLEGQNEVRPEGQNVVRLIGQNVVRPGRQNVVTL